MNFAALGAIALLAGGMLNAGAQNFAMPRHVFASGGGNSKGGAFVLSGTVGQPDAGAPLTGGAFTLTGGFWALPVAVQTPDAPVLSVMFTNNLVVVSWPLPAEDFVLEQAAVLTTTPATTIWTPVPPPYQVNATHQYITTSPGGVAAFYRLRRP